MKHKQGCWSDGHATGGSTYLDHPPLRVMRLRHAKNKQNTGNEENYDEDDGWVPAGGKEPADYSGDEDEDENENDLDEPAGPAQTEKAVGKTPNGVASSGNKKRPRENDPAEDESREQKKAKLPIDPTY